MSKPIPTAPSLSQPTAGELRRRWWLTALAAAVILVSCGFFQGKPTTVTDCSKASDPSRAGAVSEYCLPKAIQPPHAMTVGPDGNFYFTDSYNGKVVRVTPQGVITSFDVAVPPYGLLPSGISPAGIARGADGNLWYIADGKLGRVNPQGSSGSVTLPSGVVATSLTAGPDGNLWLSESRGTGSAAAKTADTIAKVTLSNQQFTAYSLAPAGLTSAGGLTPGPDGNVWFVGTTKSNAAIGRITPSGDVKGFPLDIPVQTTAPGYPACEPPNNTPCIGATNIGGLVSGADKNLWFIDGQGRIGRMTTAGATTYFRVHDLEGLSGPPALGKGPDGNVWEAFSTSSDGPGVIGRVTSDGSVKTYQLPHGGQVHQITAGPDGGVWFLLVFAIPNEPYSTQRIVRLTP